MTDNKKLFEAILNGETVTGTLSGEIREALVHGKKSVPISNSEPLECIRDFIMFITNASPEQFAKVWKQSAEEPKGKWSGNSTPTRIPSLN